MIMGHFLNAACRPCFLSVFHVCFICVGAASCHDDYEEGIMGRDYASLCNV